MADVKLQETVELLQLERLRSFTGRNIEQMPLLLSGKNEAGKVVDVPRRLITPREFLYECLHGKDERDRDFLRNYRGGTLCAVIGNPRRTGEVIVGLHSDPLVEEQIYSLSLQSDVSRDGGLVISRSLYQAIKKQAFVLSPRTVKDLKKSVYNSHKEREAFWEYIAEGDSQLVRDTLELVQEETGGGDISNRMGLFLSQHPGLRLLYIGSAGDYVNTEAGDRSLMDNRFGCLLGVAPAYKLE